jgi:hypothetical protein
MHLIREAPEPSTVTSAWPTAPTYGLRRADQQDCPVPSVKDGVDTASC